MRTARRGNLVITAAKGFGSESKTVPQKPASAEENKEEATSTPASPLASKDAEALEALEARIKNRRKRQAGPEPKVKVNAPAVDVATGKAPVPVESEAEKAYLSFMSVYFLGVLATGLLLAGSGFLPDEIDSFVQDKVYPSYTYIMLGFLGLSTVYGLFKIGKLPGQRQQP